MELLAPAGSMEAFKAAVSNGCNAVYLGMQRFGARAYSANFDEETIKEVVEYAHLRNVRIYVTMNTIIFEDELEDMKKQIQFLNEVGIDGIIVQDLAVFDYIVKNFVDLEAHCSTQMGIDDLEGTLLYKELGAKRVVLSREVPVEKVKSIRKESGVPIEIFGHGALCMSYSGNCLISGLTGNRSGNRGRCVGSCRKYYDLIVVDTKQKIDGGYLLSTKDLNTIDHVSEYKGIDSLKIEGRMKEPPYVANVISRYRMALDKKITKQQKDDLKKTFQRTFTKGYLFHEDPKDISNITRPNNYGYEIGTISAFQGGYYEVTLHDTLNQNDIVRINHHGEDVILSVVRLYDGSRRLINSASKKCYIQLKEKLSVGDIVYKTRDYQFYKELDATLDHEFKRYPLDMSVYAYPQSNLVIEASGNGVSYSYTSEEILEEAKKNPTTKEQVMKQLGKLNDTIFTVGNVEFDEYHAFIPSSLLNNARREIVQALYQEKINSKEKRIKVQATNEPIIFEDKKPYLTASVITKEQYDACKEMGIDVIYDESNTVRRNQIEYTNKEGEVLVGGYGGIHYYKGTNPFITDYSLNVTNATAVYELHRLGAKRVTLSYELNISQLKDLVGSYLKQNGGYPALEMIVYGRAPMMFTKYCPLKKANLCGKCKKHQYALKDENGIFPIQSNYDCTTVILNGKILNLLDELTTIDHVEAFRLNFTTESKEEVMEIIKKAKGKLVGTINTQLFNQETDTRGHFNKEIV